MLHAVIALDVAGLCPEILSVPINMRLTNLTIIDEPWTQIGSKLVSQEAW